MYTVLCRSNKIVLRSPIYVRTQKHITTNGSSTRLHEFFVLIDVSSLFRVKHKVLFSTACNEYYMDKVLLDKIIIRWETFLLPFEISTQNILVPYYYLTKQELISSWWETYASCRKVSVLDSLFWILTQIDFFAALGLANIKNARRY